MRHQRDIFNEQEWQKIVDEAFQTDAPRHEFRKEYLDKKAEIIGTSKGKYQKVLRYVALFAATLMIPTSVYAAYQWYAQVQQTAKYEQTIHVAGGDQEAKGYKALEINNIPEDLIKDFDGKYQSKDESEKALTIQFMRVPKDMINEAIPYTISSQTFETSRGDTAIFVERDRGYDQLWVAFKDTSYVAMAFVNEFSKEEIFNLAEGFTLVDSDVETAYEWQASDSLTDRKTDQDESFDESKVQMVKEGDSYISKYGNRITIDHITIQDNFDGLTKDSINRPMDYSEYVDDEGKIRTKRQYIKLGDGITTLDEVISEDVVRQKVVVVDLIVENITDQENGEGFNSQIFVITKNGEVIDPFTQSLDGSYACVHEQTGALVADGSFFSFENEDEGNKNSVGILKAGEKTKVKMAFLIDEDLESFYLDLEPQYSSGRKFEGVPVIKF